MNITVFGATGKTGQHIVSQALKQGHSVISYVRDQSKITISNPNLSVVEGQLDDMESLHKALNGSDGAIIAIGSTNSKDKIMSNGTQTIIQAMEAADVTSLVLMSSYPMSGDNTGKGLLMKLMSKMMAGMVREKQLQESYVRSSNFDWTIVRPAMLTNGEYTGTYQAAEDLHPNMSSKISRADVADFMLKAIQNSDLNGKVMTIAS